MRINIARIYILIILLLSAAVPIHGAKNDANPEYLINAVKDGNWDKIKFAIEGLKISPNVKDEYGGTPLMYAAMNGSQRVSEYLIDNGANLNQEVTFLSVRDRNKKYLPEDMRDLKTILNLAVRSGNESLVRLLLQKGAKIDAKDYYRNPVVIASLNNDYEMLKFLDMFRFRVSNQSAPKVLLYILNAYTKKESRTIHFDIINYWESTYNLKISDEIFEKADVGNKALMYNEKVRQTIANYIDSYSEKENVDSDENNNSDLKQKSNLINKIQQEPDPHDSYSLYDLRRKSEIEHYEQQQKEKEESSRKAILTIIFLVIGGVVFVYIKYGSLNASTWISVLDKIFKRKKTAQPNTNRSTSPANNTNARNTNTQQKPNLNTPKPTTSNNKPPKGKRQKKEKTAPYISKVEDVRGWEKDDTKSIVVEYLTIEDMINPIRLCNSHEKAVRRMMWYMRQLEEYPHEKVCLVLGEAGLCPHLKKLWSSINLTYVRIVYIRSLYLLVENYATRDTRVLSFLETMEKTTKVHPSQAKMKVK